MTRNLVIVGVGALGSHATALLRNVTDVSLTVIDFDRVEAKNTLSQFHVGKHIGKNKAEALKQTLSFLWGTKLATVPHRLEAANVEALLGKADLVIDAVDNGATRRLIQDFVRLRAIPCVHGALAPNGEYGRVVWDEQFVVDDEAGAGAPTCENGDHLSFIALVAAYLAYAGQQFLKTEKKLGFSISPAGALVI